MYGTLEFTQIYGNLQFTTDYAYVRMYSNTNEKSVAS